MIAVRHVRVHIVSMSLQLLQRICHASLNIKIYLYVVINFIKIYSNYIFVKNYYLIFLSQYSYFFLHNLKILKNKSYFENLLI